MDDENKFLFSQKIQTLEAFAQFFKSVFAASHVEPDKEDNRLRIFFDEKPDEATRSELKSSGFKWSPKAGAWQRQLTANAFYAADRLPFIQPLTGEKPTELQRKHGGG